MLPPNPTSWDIRNNRGNTNHNTDETGVSIVNGESLANIPAYPRQQMNEPLERSPSRDVFQSTEVHPDPEEAAVVAKDTPETESNATSSGTDASLVDRDNETPVPGSFVVMEAERVPDSDSNVPSKVKRKVGRWNCCRLVVRHPYLCLILMLLVYPAISIPMVALGGAWPLKLAPLEDLTKSSVKSFVENTRLTNVVAALRGGEPLDAPGQENGATSSNSDRRLQSVAKAKVEIIYSTSLDSSIFQYIDFIREFETLIVSDAFCPGPSPEEVTALLNLGLPLYRCARTYPLRDSPVNYFFPTTVKNPSPGVAEGTMYDGKGTGTARNETQVYLEWLETRNARFLPRAFTESAVLSMTRSAIHFESGDYNALREYIMGDLYNYLTSQASAAPAGLSISWNNDDLFAQELSLAVQHDAILACGSVAIVAGLMFVLMDFDLFLTVIGLISLALALPLAYAFFTVVFGNKDIFSLSFLSLYVLFGVGSDCCFIFMDEMGAKMTPSDDEDKTQKIFASWKRAASATFVTMSTTAVSFLANLSSPITVVAQWGLFMGLTTAFAWITVATTFPCALIGRQVFSRVRRRQRGATWFRLVFAVQINRFRYLLLVISIVLVSVSGALTFATNRLTTDSNSIPAFFEPSKSNLGRIFALMDEFDWVSSNGGIGGDGNTHTGLQCDGPEYVLDETKTRCVEACPSPCSYFQFWMVLSPVGDTSPNCVCFLPKTLVEDFVATNVGWPRSGVQLVEPRCQSCNVNTNISFNFLGDDFTGLHASLSQVRPGDQYMGATIIATSLQTSAQPTRSPTLPPTPPTAPPVPDSSSPTAFPTESPTLAPTTLKPTTRQPTTKSPTTKSPTPKAPTLPPTNKQPTSPPHPTPPPIAPPPVNTPPPTPEPTEMPSSAPSTAPSSRPTTSPSYSPTTSTPSATPSTSPTTSVPTQSPSFSPSKQPTRFPTFKVTSQPTQSPFVLHRCPNDCSGKGVCDSSSRLCTCNLGSTGPDCSETITTDVSDGFAEKIVFGFGLEGSSDTESKTVAAEFNLAEAPEKQEYLLGVCALVCRILRDTSSSSRCSAFIFNRYANNTKLQDLFPNPEIWSLDTSRLEYRRLLQCGMADFAEYLLSIGAPFPVESPQEFQSLVQNFSVARSSLIRRGLIGLDTRGEMRFVQMEVMTSLSSKQTTATHARETLHAWYELMNLISEGQSQGMNPLVASSLFARSETELATISGFTSSWAITTVVAILAIAIYTRSLAMALFTGITMTAVLLSAFGFCFYILEWRFGLVEAVGLTIIVGLTVDFSAHICYAFTTASSDGDEPLTSFKRVQEALGKVGLAIISSSVTTIGACSLLFATIILPFQKFGAIVCATMFLSTIFSFGLLCPLLIVAGWIPYRVWDWMVGTVSYCRSRFNTV